MGTRSKKRIDLKKKKSTLALAETTAASENIFLQKQHRWSLWDILALVATVCFITAGILVSVHRFWQYEVFYYNFGVFDQAIWKVSRFQLPIIEHLLVGGRISLADHFDVSILLLAPLFWLTERSEILLVAQATCAGLAGYVVYKIGTLLLSDKRIPLAITLCYFFFVGIQNAVITDFHELTVLSLPLSLTFYAIIAKRLRLFWALFILTLGYKEVTFLLGITIALFIYFYQPSWRRHAFFAALYASLWGFMTIKVIMPYLAQGVYLHEPAMPDGIVNKIYALFDHPLKRHTVFYSLYTFSFLPLLSPFLWPALAQDYILRFVPMHVETRWTLGLHYNAQVAPLLAISALFGLKFLMQKFPVMIKFSGVICLLLVANSFYLFRFVLHGPFMLAVHPVFYAHTKNFTFLDTLVDKIPKDAAVMTQNNLGVRFTHGKFIYLRKNYEQYNPEFIVLDMRPGQNPNNFLFAPNMDDLIAKIKQDPQYKLIYNENFQYIFQRVDSTKNS